MLFGCVPIIFSALLFGGGSIACQNMNEVPHIDFDQPQHPEKGNVTFYFVRSKLDRNLPNEEPESDAIETTLTRDRRREALIPLVVPIFGIEFQLPSAISCATSRSRSSFLVDQST